MFKYVYIYIYVNVKMLYYNHPLTHTYTHAAGVPQAAGMRRAWKGVAGEYAYLPDAYDAARQAEREYQKNVHPTPPRYPEVGTRALDTQNLELDTWKLVPGPGN